MCFRLEFFLQLESDYFVLDFRWSRVQLGFIYLESQKKSNCLGWIFKKNESAETRGKMNMKNLSECFGKITGRYLVHTFTQQRFISRYMWCITLVVKRLKLVFPYSVLSQLASGCQSGLNTRMLSCCKLTGGRERRKETSLCSAQAPLLDGFFFFFLREC